MTGCTSGGYDQLDTSPEMIEQELRPAVCERRQTDRLMENYSIDYLWLIGKEVVQMLELCKLCISVNLPPKLTPNVNFGN